MAMQSAASPMAQLIAVTIAQARAGHWLRAERVYDDDAVGGISERTAHGCGDQASLRSALAAVRTSVR